MDEYTFLLLTFVVVFLLSITSAFLVIRNRLAMLIPLLVVYEALALVLLAKSNQSLILALLEQAIAFSAIYVISNSLASAKLTVRFSVLAVIFPLVLVLLKPFRIYLFCSILAACG